MSTPHPLIDDAARAAFARDGYVHVRDLVDAATMVELEATYMRFLRGEIPVTGRDFCDMAADYGATADAAADRSTAIDRLDVLNVMLPRRYHPAWRGNAYERVAGEVARALLPSATELDYDQLVAKPPGRPAAVFHWHQDLAYWPATPEPETVTVWLALDDTDEENGCLMFVPGSHAEPALRPHLPLHGDRDVSHTLVATVDPNVDRITPAPIRRGDALCFRERVLHGSGGNPSARWRRAYVVAYRTPATVAAERAMGFTHSHSDDLTVLRNVSGLA
ncbi:MAG: phytanoyl-CoA dioxygenase family protein [Planctomycetota bacterium]